MFGIKRLKEFGLSALLLTVIFVTVSGAARNSDIYFLIKKNFTIFSEVYREVSLHYVDEVDPEQLMRKGLNAMLESLDPYTVFIDEAQNQDIEIISQGGYGGIGIDVGFRGENIVVIAPMEGYPAFKKGIRSGDIIKSIDGIPVEELSPEEVQNMTVGEPGTTVFLTIERYGVGQELLFELERERIEVKNIAYQGLVGQGNDVGYILLSRFSQNTAEEIRSAISNLKSQADLKGLILDLRNNPGGLLDEAVKTVDKFVAPGQMVVETRGRLSQQNDVFYTEEPAIVPNLPLVILQNEGSASASEIVAGALQDLDRAVVIGEQSFGKGLVQIVRPLSYNTALKITVSRYYIPSGRSIQSVTYTHDEQNTSIQKPDSLRKAFKTKNGRTVYDGEGIAPDIEMTSPKPTLLETALMQKNYFFGFANQFASMNDSYLASSVSDEVFAEFRDYLDRNGFDYQTQTERHLASVEENMDKQKREAVKDHISAIGKMIEKEKEEDFEEQREQLKHTLYLELISRYKGVEGQTAASVQFDPLVEEAIRTIGDRQNYRKILAIE